MIGTKLQICSVSIRLSANQVKLVVKSQSRQRKEGCRPQRLAGETRIINRRLRSILRGVRGTETESRMLVAMAWGDGKWGVSV